MTPSELNRDIKRLAKNVARAGSEQQTRVEDNYRAEFYRLYRADKEMRYMNKDSIRIMLRLNLMYRWEPLHSFGIFVEI